jgi:hypothetical protein
MSLGEDRIARIHMMDLKDLPDIVFAADEDKFIPGLETHPQEDGPHEG